MRCAPRIRRDRRIRGERDGSAVRRCRRAEGHASPGRPARSLAARDYLLQMTIPNVYFHIVMAYAILRHNGVDIGKDGLSLVPIHWIRGLTRLKTSAARIARVRGAEPPGRGDPHHESS